MANLLTSIRLLLIFPVAMAFLRPGFISPGLLVALLAIAIASDYFDGKVARYFNTASPKGMLFDHSTDCLFVSCTLAAAAYSGLISPLLPLLIVIAFSQYVLDSYLLYRQKQLRMSMLGRWNGVFYFLPVIVLAVSGLDVLQGWQQNLELLALWLGYGLITSSLISIVDRAVAPFKQPA